MSGAFDKVTEAKIQRGWDDMTAGRTRPAHMIFDEIRERHARDETGLLAKLEHSYSQSKTGKTISAKVVRERERAKYGI